MLGGCGCLILLLVGVVVLVLLYNGRERTKSLSKTTEPLPADYPTDIPIYPGATVERAAHVLVQTAPTDYSVTLVAKARLKDVVAFYDRELPVRGWTIGARSEADGAAARQGLKRPAKVAVSMFDRKDGTIGIVIGNTTNSPNW